MRFSIFSGVPKGARILIWQVFFASRQRGVDLVTHFPWIEQNIGIYCLTLAETNNGPVLATLVIRKHNLLEGCRSAMLGMVCVDQAWRGRGLSKQLLTYALDFAVGQQINSLILWTGQPDIYTKYGFLTDKMDSFGRIILDPQLPRAQVGFIEGSADIARGLPPFGRRLIRFQSDVAELIGVETEQGIALAESKGCLPDVLDLIEVALPEAFNLNAPAESSIFEEIRKRGHIYTPLPCARRMIRNLDTPIPIPYISVLDRI